MTDQTVPRTRQESMVVVAPDGSCRVSTCGSSGVDGYVGVFASPVTCADPAPRRWRDGRL